MNKFWKCKCFYHGYLPKKCILMPFVFLFPTIYNLAVSSFSTLNPSNYVFGCKTIITSTKTALILSKLILPTSIHAQTYEFLDIKGQSVFFVISFVHS
jgi:hypothetical protein